MESTTCIYLSLFLWYTFLSGNATELVAAATSATTTSCTSRRRSIQNKIVSSVLSSPQRASRGVAAGGRHRHLPILAFTESQLWAIRTASAVSTYFGFVAWSDRPKGQLISDHPNCLEIKPSTVPGAGFGLFAKTTMRQGTVLGTYPGVVVPLQVSLGVSTTYKS